MTVVKAALPSEESTTQVGARLRALRAEHGMTILELAAKAGLSAGLISQIERGHSNPSLKTIQRLRSALGVNIWEFLGEAATVDEAEPPFVRRRAQRAAIIAGQTKLVKELLSPRGDSPLRFMLITLPPGGVSEDVLVGRGEKGGYVLSGRVDLTVGGQRSRLAEGDSFQFESNLPHQLANPTEEEAVVFWIMNVSGNHL